MKWNFPFSCPVYIWILVFKKKRLWGNFPERERRTSTQLQLVRETLGGWHAKVVLQIKKLARAQARTTGRDKYEAIRHLFQRFVVLLVKGIYPL